MKHLSLGLCQQSIIVLDGDPGMFPTQDPRNSQTTSACQATQSRAILYLDTSRNCHEKRRTSDRNRKKKSGKQHAVYIETAV